MGRPPKNPNSRYNQEKLRREAQQQAAIAEREAASAAEKELLAKKLEAEKLEAIETAKKEQEEKTRAEMLAEMQKERAEMLAEMEKKQAEILAEKAALMQRESEVEERRESFDNDAETNKNSFDNDAETSENSFDNDAETPAETDENEDADLLKMIRERTAEKNESEKATIDIPNPDDDRFSEESKKGIPHFNLKDNPDGENVDAEMDADDSALFIIKLFDGLNKFVLPKLYEREFFTPKQRYEMRILVQKVRQTGKKTVVFTDEDLKLMDGFNEYEAFRETIPFTDDEQKNLAIPLKKMMVGRGITISPGWAFVMACAMVILPRYGVIFAKKWENRTNPPKDSEEPQEPEQEVEDAD